MLRPDCPKKVVMWPSTPLTFLCTMHRRPPMWPGFWGSTWAKQEQRENERARARSECLESREGPASKALPAQQARVLSLPTQSVRALSFRGDQAAVIAFVHDCVKTLELPAMPSAT